MQKRTIFSFFVIIFSIAGCGSNNKKNAAVPVAPAHLAALVNGTAVRLVWNRSGGALSYNVYYMLSSDLSFTRLGSTGFTSVTISGLVSGETYNFAVTALNDAGASGYSNEAGVTLISGVPADLKTISGDQRVMLRWNASSGATSYGVYVSNMVNGVPFINAGFTTTTAYTVTGLTDGTSYGFVVTAVNAGGESGFSNQINCIPVITKVYATRGFVPVRIAIDSSNNIWVTNISSGTVTNINPATGVTAGTYNAGSTPGDLAIDSTGNVWIANTYYGSVTEVNPAGAIVGTYTVGGVPEGIAIDSSDNVWISDCGNGGVVELSPSGTILGNYGLGSGFFVGVAIDSSGDVWVINQLAFTVTEISHAGTLRGTYLVGSTPMGVAIDPSGSAWIVDNGGGTLTKLSSSGTNQGTFPAGISPTGIAIDSAGEVWFNNYWNNTVTALSPTGSVINVYSVGARPEGIAIDSSGNVWVANSGDNTIDELMGIATGPQYFPYNGPQWP